jgi:hypothetical protein
MRYEASPGIRARLAQSNACQPSGPGWAPRPCEGSSGLRRATQPDSNEMDWVELNYRPSRLSGRHQGVRERRVNVHTSPTRALPAKPFPARSIAPTDANPPSGLRPRRNADGRRSRHRVGLSKGVTLGLACNRKCTSRWGAVHCLVAFNSSPLHRVRGSARPERRQGARVLPA